MPEPVKRIGSWVTADFTKEEQIYKSPNGKYSISVIPKRNVITGWNYEGWEVLYRPTKTGNMFRAGLPTMVPNFSSCVDKKFIECNTILPHHGFGRTNEWTEGEKRSSGMSYYIENDAETEKIYPFKFRFTVDVSIEDDGSLVHKLTLKNKGDRVMPVQPGLHPYFTCPSNLKKQIKTDKIEGFSAQDWEWTTKEKTPDNNYDFKSGCSFTIPEHGKVTMTEQPASDGNFYYKKIQIWSEHQDAPDTEFVCFEPVIWGADGLNHPEHRINVKPQSSITVTMKFTASK